jgi:hypothetical protein
VVDDDDDHDVKAKMIPVIIIGTTGNISRSFRKYFSNIPGKCEIKEVQQKKNSCIEHCTCM